MKVGINITNDNPLGYYSKADGLIKAALKLGLNYSLFDKKEEYDVVINWEPFVNCERGKRLTIIWSWDTHLTTMEPKVGDAYDVLFRAHATFFFDEGFDVRKRPVYWMPPAVDLDVFKRNLDIKPEYDLVFTGKERGRKVSQRIIEVLEQNFNFKHFKDKYPYEEYINLLSLGKIIVNVPEALETNKRVFESLAIGPAAMPWGPDYSLLMTPYKHYIPIPSFYLYSVDDVVPVIESFSKEIKELLGQPKLLNSITEEGRSLVEERFTFEQQVLRIEKILSHHA